MVELRLGGVVEFGGGGGNPGGTEDQTVGAVLNPADQRGSGVRRSCKAAALTGCAENAQPSGSSPLCIWGAPAWQQHPPSGPHCKPSRNGGGCLFLPRRRDGMPSCALWHWSGSVCAIGRPSHRQHACRFASPGQTMQALSVCRQLFPDAVGCKCDLCSCPPLIRPSFARLRPPLATPPHVVTCVCIRIRAAA
jgi:hypothetical protein